MICRRTRQHRDVADDQFFDRRGTAASKTSNNTTTRRRLKEIFSIPSLLLSPRGAVHWFIPYYTDILAVRKPQVAIFTGYHTAVFILAVLEWDGMGRYSKLLRSARKHTALFSDKVHTGLLQWSSKTVSWVKSAISFTFSFKRLKQETYWFIQRGQ